MDERGLTRVVAPGRLLEREPELAALNAVLDAAGGGDGRLIVVERPAGIGKKRLLSTGRELADARDTQVLSSRGGELEGAFVGRLYSSRRNAPVPRISAAAVRGQSMRIAYNDLWLPSGFYLLQHPRVDRRQANRDTCCALRHRRQGPRALAAVVGAAAVACALAAAAQAGWISAQPMKSGRWDSTATNLRDGRVLIAAGVGGQSGNRVPQGAVQYRPGKAKEWAGAGRTLVAHGQSATSTTLLDGKVLLVGGSPVAELFDPATKAWSYTGPLQTGRTRHTATLLLDGRVLVAGGYSTDSGQGINTCELYDPASGTWAPTGSMSTGGGGATATLLATGEVLVVHETTAELYNPFTGTWSPTGNPTSPHTFQTASLLLNGKVLIAGGFGPLGVSSALDVYDPGTGLFSAEGDMLSPRLFHTATVLPDGKVLLAGGFDSWDQGTYSAISKAELYDPSSHHTMATASMNVGRARHTASLLNNGEVLVAGGSLNTNGNGGGTPTATAELYAP